MVSTTRYGNERVSPLNLSRISLQPRSKHTLALLTPTVRSLGLQEVGAPDLRQRIKLSCGRVLMTLSSDRTVRTCATKPPHRPTPSNLHRARENRLHEARVLRDTQCNTYRELGERSRTVFQWTNWLASARELLEDELKLDGDSPCAQRAQGIAQHWSTSTGIFGGCCSCHRGQLRERGNMVISGAGALFGS